MRSTLLLYVAIVVGCGIGFLLLLQLGAHQQPPQDPVEHKHGPSAPPQDEAPAGDLVEVLYGNFRLPLGVLLLEVIVIVLAAVLAGAFFQRLGQPPVIGEMVAGILLGPSLLGMLFPEAQAFLFPAASMNGVQLISQIGVILFMFVVGIELDVEHFRHKIYQAVLVSHAGIAVPFCLATALCLFVYEALAPAHVSFTAFALFMSIAMSITAFPVLVRILDDRNLSRSELGTTAITCAAVGDVTAWCILAVAVAVVGASGPGPALLTILLTLVFIGLMLGVIKPLAKRFANWTGGSLRGNKGFVACVLVFVFASALATEVIGIHALFGAFLAGVVMPPDVRLRAFLRERLETFSAVFLLPLFFAFTGLRTQVGLLDDLASWATCAVVVVVAIVGKLGGTLLAARATGRGWRESFALGSLMNTRGLMELIVLNLGYDLGILPARIFAMLVIMALVTTLMTGPLLWLVAEKPASRTC